MKQTSPLLLLTLTALALSLSGCGPAKETASTATPAVSSAVAAPTVDLANGKNVFTRAEWQIDRRWRVFVDARNLTDKHYAASASVLPDASAPGADLHLLWPGDGRAFYAGVEFKF